MNNLRCFNVTLTTPAKKEGEGLGTEVVGVMCEESRAKEVAEKALFEGKHIVGVAVSVEPVDAI